ncbi:hypothetical protein BGX20_008766 [Mortierella sp. AD010]|nr:hypothetical protein BGX20_008766 [Mortierella sp. AD010]
MATLDILSAPASGELGSSGVMEREPYQDEIFPYPNHNEPLLSSHSSKYKKHSTSSQQPHPPQRSAITRTLGWSWSLVDTCYNRISAWLFPDEPEPLDLQSTIFFVSQAPIIAVVIWTWIPTILAWVFGIKTSEAGECGKAQGMRKYEPVHISPKATGPIKNLEMFSLI